jgi:glycosyltransferase involved in cell wall biosynthesis
MGDAPAVSVIVATYQRSQVLKLALSSLLDQDFTDYEVWVVGDGCTDDSAEVTASFGDARVNWVNLRKTWGTRPSQTTKASLTRAGNTSRFSDTTTCGCHGISLVWLHSAKRLERRSCIRLQRSSGPMVFAQALARRSRTSRRDATGFRRLRGLCVEPPLTQPGCGKIPQQSAMRST